MIVLLLVGLWIANRVSSRFSSWLGAHVFRIGRQRIDARVQRLRTEDAAAAREPGSAPPANRRIAAGVIDLVLAVAAGALVTLLLGIRSETYYYYADGSTQTETSVNFSFGLFLLLALLFYVAEGLHAAFRAANRQTPGQLLNSYAPRTTNGDVLSAGALLKRHMARVPAGPLQILARFRGDDSDPAHDGWTDTTARTLGNPVPAAA